MKKSIILALALMFVAVSANAEIEPTEVVHREGEQRSIEKVYVLPLDEPDEPIPTDGFAEDGVQYEFAELLREDNMTDDIKDYSENASVKSSTDDTQAIIAMFEPAKDVETEDGYTGTIEADFSTLSVKSAGTGSQSYTITERRSYPNMNSADTSAVPKSIDKNGATLELTDIEWVSAENDSIDGQNLAVRYTANAVYTGTGTRSYSKGYNATVEYKGQITKKVVGTVTYTAVFREAIEQSPSEIEDPVVEPPADEATKQPKSEKEVKQETPKKKANPLLYLLYIPGFAALAAGGYVVYRMVRKKRQGF